jgi:hypothetical protein
MEKYFSQFFLPEVHDISQEEEQEDLLTANNPLIYPSETRPDFEEGEQEDILSAEDEYLNDTMTTGEEESEWESETFYTEMEEEVPQEVVRNWGDKNSMSREIEKLVNKELRQIAGKMRMSPSERSQYKAAWKRIQAELFTARKSLILQGYTPPLGGPKIPFGFLRGSHGSYSGLGSGSRYFHAERMDIVLADLQRQGKINLTQDELDLFQRIANVETGGKIQTLNTYDRGIVSIGFMQFTIHVGKVQEWIALAPTAFSRFGIELDSTSKYILGKSKVAAIKGVAQSRIDDLRWNGWAERFYYSAFDPDIIVAEVNLAKQYMTRHLRGLRARLKNDRIYNEFFNNYYITDRYVRGLFQESYNNNPAHSTGCVRIAISSLQGKIVAVNEFIQIYTQVLQGHGWGRLVNETAQGTNIVLQPNVARELDLVSHEELVDVSEIGEWEDEEFIPENESGETEWEENEFKNFEPENISETQEESAHYEMEEFADESELKQLYEQEDESDEQYISESEWEEEAYQPELEQFTVDSSKGQTIYMPVSAGGGLMAKTGVFIPVSFTPSSSVDVIVYFHGHTGSYNKAKKIVVDARYRKNGVEWYWSSYSNIREYFYASSKNAILIAPTLGVISSMQFGSFGNDYFFDEFLSACFRELKSGKYLPQDAAPGRLILAAHSGGGNPMGLVLTKKNKLVNNVTEVWGFDCLYGNSIKSTWIGNYDTWAKSNPSKTFYHYWAQGRNYTPATRGKELSDANNNIRNVAPPKFIAHRDIIEYAWTNEINKRLGTWFPAAPAISPETFSSSDCALLPITGNFKRVAFTVSREISKGAAESPYDFTRKTLRKVSQDPDEWFRSFTNITFLGVGLNYPIHVQMAQMLKNIEKTFLDQYSPVNRNIEAVRKRLGVDTEIMAGGRKTPTAALKSMHLFGLAIDVNYTGSPFIQNKTRTGFNQKTRQQFTIPNGVVSLNSVLVNAGRLLNEIPRKFTYGLKYDDYKKINDLLVSYLKLCSSDRLLTEKLNLTQSLEWRSTAFDSAKRKIQADLDRFALSVDRYNHRERLQHTGFLCFTKEFVEGMIRGGLDWGGSSYGDMMHFDMRAWGIGKCIHLSR